MTEGFRTRAIEDDVKPVACSDCGTPYQVVWSRALEKFIFLCEKCSSSCGTVVIEIDGEEVEVNII